MTDELEELALFLSGADSTIYDRMMSAAYLHDSGKEHANWQDYVMGLASTMSFLPVPLQPTFHESDRAALASDWLNVQSDFNKAWQVILSAESECDEQGERRKIPTAE